MKKIIPKNRKVKPMMDIKEMEFNDEGRWIRAKGTFKRSKVFSITTDYVLYWAELGLDYCGGGRKYE